MLVEVCLRGVLGKEFGRSWNIAARSPSHALKIIDANVNGRLCNWLRAKASTYSHYRVVCEYTDGSVETLSEEAYELERGRVKRILFTPVILGAGGKGVNIGQIVVGVVLMVVAFYGGGPQSFMAGAMMVFGGVSALLAPKAKKGDQRTSYYFNGTEQTQHQGSPIQLIYGRCLVSGFAISVATSVDQMILAPNQPLEDFISA